MWSKPYKPAARETVNSVMKVRKEKSVEEVSRLHDFQHEFSAPVTRITPSAQVGRLSGSHSDIGFLLTQFPRGRKAKERQGAKGPRI